MEEKILTMILPGYKHFGGRQVEAAALKNVLAYLGVTAPHTGQPFTDALLFGLGGGLGLGYFVYASAGYTALFVATRITTEETKQPGFLQATTERLGGKLTVQKSSNAPGVERKIKQALAEGRPPIVWVNPQGLPYPGTPYGYHPLVVFGIDEEGGEVHLADRSAKAVTISQAEFVSAQQGGDPPRFRTVLVAMPRPPKSAGLKAAVRQGLRDTCEQMQNGFGPKNFRSNFGLSALEKWANLLADPKDARGWPKFFPPGPRLYQALTATFDQIENRGGGGSALRGLYADFLDEAASILRKAALNNVAGQFRESERLWGRLSAALLPDSVPLLKEAKRLMVKRRTLFEKKGLAARDEIRAADARLAEIRARMDYEFPLSAGEAADLLANLRERVLSIHAAEAEAIRALKKLAR